MALLCLLCGLEVAVRSALVHGEGGGLPVRLPTVVAGVGFAVRVHHVVFVQTGVLREALSTAWHSAHIRFFTCTHTEASVIVAHTHTACSRGRTVTMASDTTNVLTVSEIATDTLRVMGFLFFLSLKCVCVSITEVGVCVLELRTDFNVKLSIEILSPGLSFYT